MLEGITTTQVKWSRLTSEPYMPLMMTALCVPSAGCRWMQEAFSGEPASTKERNDEQQALGQLPSGRPSGDMLHQLNLSCVCRQVF